MGRELVIADAIVVLKNVLQKLKLIGHIFRTEGYPPFPLHERK
jgi:hypothetical protein